MKLPGTERTTPERASLDALLARVALGDEDAFEALYDESAGLVFGLIKRVVRDPGLSEEVLQEVFVEVWQHATRYDAQRGSARSWICTVAHRRAVDRVRAAQASTERDLTQGIKEFQESTDDVADIAVLKADMERVLKALETLTQMQRDAIRLAYFGGYTHQEVAKLLQVPMGTVKTRIRDGMIILRDRLGVA
ncbi:ECF RNA polymerase sigma factor SigK [Zhihengliuella flava]|uniref:RNA polymerase sigma factor n=1 Tax=Zhihengliuella flava TaxID=1285193 RepID=A0A931GF81_9MICC|nr:ECF RNA polymerase sigma factor SigK [Zhihengliuella flava]MBG6084377.1 RNA polymerase sigma-70 factor (ECF subfamily) [Zhihengliuella flava]